MKVYNTLVILLISSILLNAQEQYSLAKCHQLARNNYPLIKQRKLLEQASDFNLNGIVKGNLPKIALNAQLTNQSDVTGLPIEIPGQSMPQIPKTQYKATIDVQQFIYDGGMIKNQTKVEKASLMADQQMLEVSLYEVKERVTKLYFGVLLINEQNKLFQLMADELKDKMTTMESGVRNGIVEESRLNELKAEYLKVEQGQIELRSNHKALLDVLGILIGDAIVESAALAQPKIDSIDFEQENSRPEHLYFDYQKAVIGSNQSLIGTSLKPRVYGFAQVGVGRPGLNFLDDDTQGFYIAGIKLQWNLWDWNKNNHAQQRLSIRQKIIDTQRETFDLNMIAAMKQKQNEINKLNALMEKDQQIIELRTSIKENAARQLDGGVITPTEYLTQLNAENKSKLDYQVRTMELEMAKVDCILIMGKDLSEQK